MNKSIKIIIGIILVIALICGVFLLEKYNRSSRLKNDNLDIIGATEDSDLDVKKSIVNIQNGKIQNEYLIDEFIENVRQEKEVELIIKQDQDNIKLQFIAGEVSSYNLPMIPYETKDDSAEEYIRAYGAYVLTVNGEETEKLDAIRFCVSRRNEGNDVYLTFEPRQIISYICLAKPIDICKYSLDSSNYEQVFEITYNQRKDLGIKRVYEGEYNVYTYGGDVDITIEKDMVYRLENALTKGVISPDDIVKQAEMDKKYGICEARYYKDGGSIEYSYYRGFTILKYNTLEGNKDLVIGMNGQIINDVNEKLY